MGRTFAFTVYGKPEPRGSKQSFVPLHPKTKEPFRRKGGGIVVSTVDDNKKSKGWMQAISAEARDTFRDFDELIEGPIRLSLVFYMPRPGYHFGTGRNEGKLKPQYETVAHTVKPDRLKLARAVEDALTGIAYKDDAQTIAGGVSKWYCAPGTSPRVEITIEELT